MTIVEYLERILPLADVEISAELARRYRRAGIQLLTVTKDDAQQVLEADKVLQATGFTPRVTGYGLETTGVALTERGASAIDKLLPELTLAQLWDLTSTELARNVHAHPTLSEAVKEALHGLAGHMINI